MVQIKTFLALRCFNSRAVSSILSPEEIIIVHNDHVLALYAGSQKLMGKDRIPAVTIRV